MAKKKIEIVWSKDASSHFLQLLEYLFSESEEAAQIVGNAILDEIENLPDKPYKYPADRFKKNNDSHYRAFVVFSYRVSYYVSEHEIIILRIRHTSREPLEY
jgi:plasmid stabilization system protein ParE